MKRKINILVFTVIVFNLLFFNSLYTHAQNISSGLSVKAGTGLTSFYGELGASGFTAIRQVRTGFSGSVVKMFNPVFGIQAQYTGANLHAERADLSQYFDGFIHEVGLSARLELQPMFIPNRLSKIHPYLRAGIATTLFRSVRREIGTNTVQLPTYGYRYDGLTKDGSENALSIPLAFGISYHLTDNIAIEAEQSLSLTNSDILDAYVGTAPHNDMFGFSQLGIKITLDPIKRTITPSPRDAPSKTKKSFFSSKKRQKAEPVKEQMQPKETNIYVESIIPDQPISGKVFEVNLRINKSDYTGRGVLTQTFPRGFTAMESTTSDAVFSFLNQKVEIIWEQMPEEEIIEYSYLVRPGNNTRGAYTINGTMEYQQPDGTQTVHFANYIDINNQIESNMDERILGILDQGQQDKQQRQENAEKKDVKEGMDLKIEDLLNKYTGETTEAGDKTRDSAVTSEQWGEHEAVSGIEFRIQIGAFASKELGRKIVRKYNLPESVTEEVINGLYKYTLGSFKDYASAANYRDTFIKRTQIWGAFVVAYKDGVRYNNLKGLIK